MPGATHALLGLVLGMLVATVFDDANMKTVQQRNAATAAVGQALAHGDVFDVFAFDVDGGHDLR
jgi:hypothetical protein